MIVTRLSRRWDVPDEFWLLWWRNREHRQLIIDVPVEPASKGPAGKAMAPEFQRQVMDRMEEFGRYPMTGPVALDLHFRAARRNPPVIYRTVKYTLDLLGAAVPGSERPRRRNVLYRDDRQVKFLYADLDQQWQRKGDDSTSTGGLWMVARRASDVAADLSMAARLHESHLDENDEESPFWVPTIPEDPDLGWPLEPASGRTPVEQYLADVTRFHHVADVQEAMLAGTDATLIWGARQLLRRPERRRARGTRVDPGGVAGGDPQPAPVGAAHAPAAQPAAGAGTVGGLHPDDPRQPRRVPGTRAAVPVPPGPGHADLPRRPARAG